MRQYVNRRCDGVDSHCGGTTMHSLTEVEGQKGYRCTNCRKFTPISIQGQSTPKAIQDVMDKLSFEHKYSRDVWTGYVTLDELRMLLQHHTMRNVSVSAGTFGLIDLPKKDIARWCKDDFRQSQQKRLEDKTGRPVEVSVTLYQDKKPSGWTHSISVHGMYAFITEERTNYYPFD